jgi:SAM-dependent methyltransferase
VFDRHDEGKAMTTSADSSPHRLSHSEPRPTAVYDSHFYESQLAPSLQSARIYLGYLWQFLQPASVLDVGCGRGAWLRACHELGSRKLLGFDGDWNSQSAMVDSAVEFQSIDLNKPFSVPEKVDLAMTLEVAEHLDPSTARQFIKCMTDTSDAVLFSAAYSKQGGTSHINEQRHSYWAGLFGDRGFAAFDLFRPVYWGRKDVCFWYRQNAFLYVRKGSPSWHRIGAHGLKEIADVSFMDCIHPELFDLRTAELESGVGFKNHISDLVPSLWRALRRRLP